MHGKLFTGKYLIILIFFSIPLEAQILNGGFENWITNISVINPENWITNNAFGYTVISKSDDKHLGESALKGEVVNYDSSSVPPLLFGSSDGMGFNIGQRYASLDGYYKFVPVTGDVFNVIIIMYKNSLPITSVNTSLSSSSDYTKFSVPITYKSPEIPDKFFVEFTITDPTASTLAHIGSNFLLDDIELTGEVSTDVKRNDLTIPDGFYVYQNFPNPFNPATTIRYSIPEASFVTISIYDITGNLIAAIVNKEQSRGDYETIWNGKNNEGVQVVSGVYFYRVQAGRFNELHKMVLLR